MIITYDKTCFICNHPLDLTFTLDNDDVFHLHDYSNETPIVLINNRGVNYNGLFACPRCHSNTLHCKWCNQTKHDEPLTHKDIEKLQHNYSEYTKKNLITTFKKLCFKPTCYPNVTGVTIVTPKK